MSFKVNSQIGRSLFLLLIMFACLRGATAEEVIVMNPNQSASDDRLDYLQLLLTKAMERTIHLYGPYRIEQYPTSLTRKRSLALLVKGKITVYVAPTSRKWEAAAIPVRIPLRKGILGYRLFFIRDKDQALFSEVSSMKELLKFRLGQGAQWTITQSFKRLGIKVSGGVEYEPLFKMLEMGRFDYFPRGINEIFREYETRKNKFPTLKIEDTLSIYLPLPQYFFVPPTRPDLAKRIEIGLLSILEDGTFDKFFMDYHREDIKKARWGSRKIFELKNLNLPDGTPFDRPEFWYKPDNSQSAD